MLKAADLRGLYAIIPTPATPGAERVEALDTVDVPETERVVDRLIKDGVNGLIALGTTGECATLTPSEYDRFVEAFLSAVRKRVPTFVGTTALGSHEIARRMALARDRGADGVLLGMPMWQPLTVDMAVEHYRAMSESFPGLAIMVYANARAFRFNFSDPDFWAKVVNAAPTVMSAKFSIPGPLLALQEATKGRVHFLPNEGAVSAFAKISPQATTACWATAASMGPEPAQAMINAILDGDEARIESVTKDIKWASEPIESLLRAPEVFASYNIQVEKIRINAAGYCNSGPIRPPYATVPKDIEAMSVECGQRWRTLCERYAPQGSRRTS